MSLKKHINRTLILGLAISSVYVSTHTVYALNENPTKLTNKSTKVELKVEKEEIVKTKSAVVKTSVLNVREEASQESEKLGALSEGMVVTILETKEEWTKVRYAGNKEGWVSSEFIANEKAKVNTNELNLRKTPSTKEEELEKLTKDTELEIINTLEVKDLEEETTELWYEVKVVEEAKKEEAKKESDDEKESEKKIEEKKGFVFAEYVLTESQQAELEKEARMKAEAEQRAKEQAQAQAKEEAQKAEQNSAVQNNTVQNNTVQNNTVTSNNSSNNTTSSSKEPANESSSANLSGRTITVNASAYSGHGITSTGTVPKWGTIAVDPSVIPYGTKVYIPMFDKVFIAEDCGSAIKGNKIDIFMNSESETTNFGRRNIEIKILG